MGYMGILLQYAQSHILSTQGGLYLETIRRLLGCHQGFYRSSSEQLQHVFFVYTLASEAVETLLPFPDALETHEVVYHGVTLSRN